MDRNLLSPYIRHAMYSTLLPNYIINRRVIFDYEIIYIKEGSFKIQIDGVDYICQKNNVVFLRPGVPHIFYVGKYGVSQPHIHFDAIYSPKSLVTPISFKDMDAMTPEEISLIQEDVLSDINIPCVFSPEDPSSFQRLFFNIIDAFIKGSDSQLKAKAKIALLIDMVISQFDKEKPALNKNPDTVIAAVKNYIDENHNNILTLDFLSEMFFINKFTLIRKFKKTYGINIIKYYNEKRLETAKNLLKKSNMTIKQIGDMLNFTDAYSFSRFFKSSVGISPKEYRKTF